MKAFSSGGAGVSVGVVAWFCSRGAAATGVDWVSGGGGETGLGCTVVSSALVVGGVAGGGSGGSAVVPAASTSNFLESDAPEGSGAVVSCLEGGSVVGSGGAAGDGDVGGGVLFRGSAGKGQSHPCQNEAHKYAPRGINHNQVQHICRRRCHDFEQVVHDIPLKGLEVSGSAVARQLPWQESSSREQGGLEQRFNLAIDKFTC